MAFVSEWTRFETSAEAVFVALLATVVGIGCLIAFILARRAIRARYFARRDRRNQHIREHWDAIVNGGIPPAAWFFDPIDHALTETIALDGIEAAEGDEADRLKAFVRRSGLLDKRIREVRSLRGWRRREALIALGRMRSADGLPALVEALSHAAGDLAVDAVRALGQVGTPRAAEAILDRMAQAPLQCPLPVLQPALVSCYRSDAAALYARLLEADDSLRPVLARALAEVVRPGMSEDVGVLAADPLPEVRAAAARALAVIRPPHALLTLTRLAADKEWFVRLRAVVALGALGEPRGLPALVRALCDANRLVRLRAAASLVQFAGREAQVLELALRTRDKYAVQALVSELDRAGRIAHLVEGLADDEQRNVVEPALLAVLRGGAVFALTDRLVHHPDRRVRTRLARLMAAAEEPGLVDVLEQAAGAFRTGSAPRELRWLVGRLHRARDERRTSPEELAV